MLCNKLTLLIMQLEGASIMSTRRSRIISQAVATRVLPRIMNVVEKMKNSSPKKLSADCWPTVGRQSTDSRTTVDRQSANCWPTVVYRLPRKPSAGSRPTVGRLSADCWPHVSNLLAKCRLRTLVEYQKSLSSQGRTLHIDAK